MPDIFAVPTNDECAQQMADCLPQGRAWGKKNVATSNMRKLINSLSVVYQRVYQQANLLAYEFYVNQTTYLLPEWETSVGLPDDCGASLAVTTAQRQAAVIERLRKVPIVTLAELQAYVDNYFPDLGVVLFSRYEDYPPWGMSGEDDSFYVLVGIPTSNYFEYTLEMTFGGGIDTTALICKLNKVLPANVIPVIVEM